MLLTNPLPSIEAYVEFFSKQEMPILRRTAQELDYFQKEVAETVSAREITTAVMNDPLLTIRVLQYLQHNRRKSQNHDITTLPRAIMMIGIQPFLTIFTQAPVLEEQITEPQHLLGVLRIIARARRAAHFARDWANARHDIDVDEITVAALLHEAVEIVCWCFAPTLVQSVYAMQAANPTLHTEVAQRQIFGFSANDLQLELARAWEMPSLLVDLLDAENLPDNPRVQTVRLAGNFARHLSNRGWDNPALPSDLAAIQELLHMSRDQILHRVGVPMEHQDRFLLDEPSEFA
ncbi:MAG: HDOD domain-containing protein [Rhodocyclaceae bacterium]|nr:HDOD domain-containing protein [Rhodocyclaceae bacterium]MBR4736942.1 HDOD domain-containing protein [Rhodocyclaceae bacterium]MBR4876416.1 HDOD domain-containing protein [Rhodocyclaceae bacterium]